MQSVDTHSFMGGFAAGLASAKGDRLIDVLGILQYNIEKPHYQPDEILEAASGLLPALLEIVEDDQTDLGLRGAAAEVLAAVGVVVAQAAADPDSLPSSSATASGLRPLVVRGWEGCLDRPTSIAGRRAIVDALAHFGATHDVQRLIRKAKADPTASIRRKAANL
jgi:HEAT repeat protein